MSLNVTFNGSNFIIPETGEVGWGGNTTSYLVAIAAGALQKTGGSFTLSAELDFGASFGIKSLYYKSRSANIAAAGILRLNNNSDSISWRNAANSADLALFPNASNLLTFNGSTIYTIGAGTITNADISPSAAIAYSKLNLTNSIVNADVNASAAIAYSKLNLSLSIVNADINAAAAIAYSKLNLSNSIVNADVNAAAAIVYSKLSLTNSIVNADVNATAAIALTKLAATTASRMLVSDTSGFIVPSAWSYDASNNLTTGVQDELRFQDSAGGDYVAFRAPAAVTTHTYDLPIAPGTAGQVLSWQAGGQLQWINAAGGGTINSGNQYQLAYYAANGTTLSGLTLITGNRALQSDANGLPIASTVTDTELGYVSGVTSAIQTQLNNKAAITLSNLASVAINTTLVSDTDNTDDLGTIAIAWKDVFLKGALKSGGTTLATITELGYLTGVTSAIQTQLNLKAPLASPTFTGTVTIPDGTAAAPGLVLATATTSGLYKFDTNVPAISANGISSVRFYQYGISVGPSASALSAGFVADFRDDTASQTTSIRVLNNESTSGTSNTRLAVVTNATGGDPYLYITDQDTFGWGIGQDNSDGDKLFIYRGASGSPDSPSTGTAVMTFDTSLRVAIGTKNPGSYNSNADDFVIANAAGVVGMTLRCNTNSSNVIAFTDAEGTTVQGLIQYDHNATANAEKMTFRVGGTDVGEMTTGGIRFVQTSSFTASDGTNSFTVGTIEANFLLIAKGYALIFISGQFTTGGTVTGSLLRIGGIGTIASSYNLVSSGTITGYGHGLVTTNAGGDPRGLLSPAIQSSSTLQWQRANGAAWSTSTVYNFHATVFAQIA